MEIQLVIARIDGSALGDFASVQRELVDLFPGIEFRWSTSGIEKLADAEARGIDLPPIVRRVLEKQRACLCGSLDDGRLAVSFPRGERAGRMRLGHDRWRRTGLTSGPRALAGQVRLGGSGARMPSRRAGYG